MPRRRSTAIRARTRPPRPPVVYVTVISNAEMTARVGAVPAEPSRRQRISYAKVAKANPRRPKGNVSIPPTYEELKKFLAALRDAVRFDRVAYTRSAQEDLQALGLPVTAADTVLNCLEQEDFHERRTSKHPPHDPLWVFTPDVVLDDDADDGEEEVEREDDDLVIRDYTRYWIRLLQPPGKDAVVVSFHKM